MSVCGVGLCGIAGPGGVIAGGVAGGTFGVATLGVHRSTSYLHRRNIVGFGDVGPNRHRLSTGRGRRPDHLVCFPGAGPVVDHHPKSLLRED